MRLIDVHTPVRIEVSLEGKVDSQMNYLWVYGDYESAEENIFEGPSFSHTPFETSRWKFWAFLSEREKADNRLYKVTPLKSLRTVSSYFDGKAWHENDLSSERGRQSGTYRIRLQLKRKGGYYIRTDESGEQNIVWAVHQEGDVPVPKDYLIGRLQRQADVYFSGHDIF
jgi:hypothetical protein